MFLKKWKELKRMETKEMENVEIGEDTPQMSATKCVIADCRVDVVKNKDGKEIGKKVILSVDHPDAPDRKIEISSVKYNMGDKVKISGIWMNLDKDKNIPYKSALASMLRHLKKKKISDLKGEKIMTVTDEQGYLAVKAY